MLNKYLDNAKRLMPNLRMPSEIYTIKEGPLGMTNLSTGEVFLLEECFNQEGPRTYQLDYVLSHELAHLNTPGEQNVHGGKFWMVAFIIHQAVMANPNNPEDFKAIWMGNPWWARFLLRYLQMEALREYSVFLKGWTKAFNSKSRILKYKYLPSMLWNINAVTQYLDGFPDLQVYVLRAFDTWDLVNMTDITMDLQTRLRYLVGRYRKPLLEELAKLEAETGISTVAKHLK